MERTDALADSKPAFVALLYYCRDNNAYETEPADLDAFIAQRIRLVQAGDTTPIDLRRSNGEVIPVQCTVLPNGGRLLTYTLVTDIVRHADELEDAAQRPRQYSGWRPAARCRSQRAVPQQEDAQISGASRSNRPRRIRHIRA